METFKAKKELGNPGYSATYYIKAESKEEALKKLRKITGEYIMKVTKA